MPRDFTSIALELALKAVGHKFPRLSQIAGANRYARDEVGLAVRWAAPEIDGHAYFLLDLTRTEQRRVHLIEANGSNAALSSSVMGRDDSRSRHMYVTFRSRSKRHGQVVCLLAHPTKLMHFAEFYLRAGMFADRLNEDQPVELRHPAEELGNEEVAVIVGSISDIATKIERHGRSLLYRGRPVVFATNPNILPELVRLDTIACIDGTYDIDVSIFHEGNCTPIVHNKGLQQDLAAGTGITPLRWTGADDLSQSLPAIASFQADGMVAVGKMNAGSGGTGIEFFTPDMSPVDCSSTLERLGATAREKYGKDADRTLYPIRFFEFAKSTFYDVYGKPHLWDIRLQCLVQPGIVEVVPCIIRLCPEPFDGSFQWNTVVSNLSGRDPELAQRFLRSPFANRRSQSGTVLEAIGMTETDLDDLMRSCAKWCAAAWKAAAVAEVGMVNAI